MTAFWGMANTAVVFNIMPLFESRGLTEQHAALLFTGFAVSLAVMQLVGGVLADRFPLSRLLSVAAVGMVVCMIGSGGSIRPPWSCRCRWRWDARRGCSPRPPARLWPRYYGTAHIGRIRGALATVMVSASSVGPFILGLSVDWLGDYSPALVLFVILALPLSALALFATPPRSGETPRQHEPHATPADEPPEAML